MPSPRRTRPKLPYKLHPLYPLRRKTLWTLAIGIVLTIFCGYSPGPEFTTLLFLFPFSALFVIYDLMTWAIEKAGLIAVAGGHDSLRRPRDEGRCPRTHPISHSHQSGLEDGNDDNDNEDDDDDDDDRPAEPKWPRKFFIIFDAIFAVVYQCLFWATIDTINRYHYSYDNKVAKSYAALAGFVMSLLHGRACWLEFMERLKKKWMRTLKGTPCRRCGFVSVFARDRDHERNDDEAEDAASRLFGLRKENFGVPGWAKSFNERRVRATKGRRQRDDVEAGPSNDDDDESESLVIAPTPEGSSERPTLKGYGTLSESVRSLNREAEGIVKKKGAKRIVGEEWIEKMDSGKGKGKDQSGGDGEMGA